MASFEKAKWIWISETEEPDSYGEFITSFSWQKGQTLCRISCDGDYTLFVNGSYVSAWQYGDFSWYKSYDELDITEFLHPGENTLAVCVWHYGANSQRYKLEKAGLLFEVVQGESVLCSSNREIVCRKSRAFASGKQKWITHQMGFSFAYDATREDDWKTGVMPDGKPAVETPKDCQMVKRPVKKHKLLPPAQSVCLQCTHTYWLFDLGQETTGIPMLKLYSDCEQDILVQWGEDLQNGHVRRLIAERDFSFQYRAKCGENVFADPMLRMGCRYIEVYAQKPAAVHYAGLCPTVYPVETRPYTLSNPEDQKIYDLCEKTLRLCMMDRYVDTPWREQCLYVYDARNQILSGFYAFRDGNKEFARANLALMAQDRRPDGLLSITYPCGNDLTIPSFSLHYFRAIREYGEHTGDWSLAGQVYPKLSDLLHVFLRQQKDGLVYSFAGNAHWNFYDWAPALGGDLYSRENSCADLVLNCLFIIACQDFLQISRRLNRAPNGIEDRIAQARKATRNTFFRKDVGLFAMLADGEHYTVLGNALAILAGLTDEKEARYICDGFQSGLMTDCSLSMKCFPYDAMLQTDPAYGQTILAEIRQTYGNMLSKGATSVWETAEGATAFENAGSLCHGWSAIPIYYYHRLHCVSDPERKE